MAGPCYVLRARAIFHCQHSLGNHLAGVGPDNVDAQDTVRLGIGQELDHAVGIKIGLGARIGGKGKRADFVLDTLLLEFLLVLSHPGNLGVAISDTWNAAIINMTVALGDELDGSHSLFFSLVCQHGAESAVADHADVGVLGAVFLVNDQASTVVRLQTNVLQTETGSVRAPANGNKDDISVELPGELVSCAPIQIVRLEHTVSALPPFAASTLIFSDSPLSSPSVTFVLSLNFKPCFVKFF